MGQEYSFEVSGWPPGVAYGMQTGAVPRGVKVRHNESGIEITVTIMRNQYQNRAIALAGMTAALEHWQKIE